MTGAEIVADGIVYFGLMLWSWAKCLLIGGLIAAPLLWAWSMCVAAGRADQRSQRQWDSRDRRA